MATPSKMTPGTTRTIPFASGVALPLPAIDRINAGLKALQSTYGLNGKLRLAIAWTDNTWLYEMYHVDNQKPLVMIRNRDIGAMNRFFSECGRVIAKTYGPQEATTATRTRKTA
ncbi:MAG: hypothetical protein PHC88_05375 [Terrimicrobiaceae bacterium]|nr:hypothetical protein [Terrimicrobiaceae bacterium]